MAGWEVKNNDTYDRYYIDTTFGTCFEQTKAVPIEYYSEKSLGAYKNMEKRYSEYCATPKNGLKKLDCGPLSCDFLGWSNNKNYFVRNNEGGAAGIELYLDSSNNLLGSDKDSVSYSYDACKAKNPTSIAGFNSKGYVGHFNTADECKKALVKDDVETKIKISRAELNGECYELKNVDGVRPLAQENLNIGGPVNERCQCTTANNTPGLSLYAGVYYVDEYGNKNHYSEVIYQKSTVAGDGFCSNIANCYNAGTREWTGIFSFDPDLASNYINGMKKCFADHPKKQYYNSVSGGCFEDLTKCNQSTCTTEDRGKYKVNNAFITLGEANRQMEACGPNNPTCILSIQNALTQRCDCSTAFNPNYTPILCAAGESVGSDCTEKCRIVPAKLVQIKPEPLKSPLAFIKVIVNFLFWIAVLLFILNFVTAGIEMVQAGDEPEKMKEATERVTSTIFGFVFILVASGLINYLIGFVSGFITAPTPNP